MCRNVGVFVRNATVIRSYPIHTFALFVIQKSLKFGRAFPVLFVHCVFSPDAVIADSQLEAAVKMLHKTAHLTEV